METIYEAPMIYTRIEWIWTDEGLEETFVESCEYEGEFMMFGGGDGGGSSGNGGNGDGNGGNQNQNKNKNKNFNPSGNIYTQPTSPTPTPTPTPSVPSGDGGGGWESIVQGIDSSVGLVGEQPSEGTLAGLGRNPALSGLAEGGGLSPTTIASTSSVVEDTPSVAAGKAMQHATIHGTLKDTEWENDAFMLNTTRELRTKDADHLGSGGEGTGGGRTESVSTTGTGGTPTGGDTSMTEEEEPLTTFVDDEALRKTRRRLRDRMGRRSTRGRGGAETVGTGYSLGG